VETGSVDDEGTVATFKSPAESGLTMSGPLIVAMIARNAAQRIPPGVPLRFHIVRGASMNQALDSLRIVSEAKHPVCLAISAYGSVRRTSFITGTQSKVYKTATMVGKNFQVNLRPLLSIASPIPRLRSDTTSKAIQPPPRIHDTRANQIK
jgi:hypothetical protein